MNTFYFDLIKIKSQLLFSCFIVNDAMHMPLPPNNLCQLLDDSLTVDRTNKMIICHDYWKAREPDERYDLCPDCPKPSSTLAKYRCCCDKHNK